MWQNSVVLAAEMIDAMKQAMMMKQRTMRTRYGLRIKTLMLYLATLIVVIYLLISSASCGVVISSPIQDFSEIDSSHAVAAMYFTPYAPDRKEDDKSYIVLMNPDGSYHLVPTESMGYGSIDWEKTSGIYFSGPLREHWYSPGNPGRMFSSPSVKLSMDQVKQESEQNGLLSINDGEYHLSFINGGFTGDEINGIPGYKEQVVVSHRDKTSQHMWEGGDMPHTLAACGNDAYAVIYYEAGYGHNVQSSYILHQIFHNGIFKDRVISKSVASLPSELVGTGLSVGSATAACHNDEIVWLSRGTLATKDYPNYRLPSYLPSDLFQQGNYEGEKSIMSVIHWNIRTGVRTEVPLRNSKNKRFRFDLRSIPLMNGQSLRKNKLYWVESATGHIYATDITTGETEKKTTVPEVTQYKHAEVLADFTDTQIITMVVPQTSDSRDVFVGYFDKSTGKRTKRIVMKGLNMVRKQVNALPYGFTVNPEEK